MVKRLLQLVVGCFHENVGWPMSVGDQAVPYQHCLDCGAQRMYFMQPKLLAGPWEHPQVASDCAPRLPLDRLLPEKAIDFDPARQCVDEMLARYEDSLQGDGALGAPAA